MLFLSQEQKNEETDERHLLGLSFIHSLAATNQAEKSCVATIMGDTRGIRRGIAEVVADSGQCQGFLLTCNANKQAAVSFESEFEECFVANYDEFTL